MFLTPSQYQQLTGKSYDELCNSAARERKALEKFRRQLIREFENKKTGKLDIQLLRPASRNKLNMKYGDIQF